MNEQAESEIENILPQLDGHPDPNDPTTEETEPTYQQPRKVIDVYVIEHDDEAEEPPSVESTLEPQPIENQHPTEQERPSSHHRPHPHWLALALVVLCILLPIAGSSVYLLYLLTPSATVTLVTTSQHITSTSTVHVVSSGAADPMKQQIAGRMLSSVTMSQQKTIPTTGTTRQDARAGHGIITFYNAAPYVQSIDAGTLLTGADGVQIITDQDATIPAAVMPTEGQANTSAHAAITGPMGNIRAGDLYGQCCRLNVFAANEAFTGGQDARTYQTVTQQDINNVVTSVKTGLDQSVQAALQTQVQPTETLVTPLSCTQKVTADHQPGEEAVQVSITVDETCTSSVYNTQAFIALTTQLATQDTMKRLGTGYTTTGVQTSITQATPKEHGSRELEVKSVGLWTYQFGEAQQQAIKAMIAGKSQAQAKAILLHLTGVQSVSVSLTNGTTLPTDVERIHLLLLQL